MEASFSRDEFRLHTSVHITHYLLAKDFERGKQLTQDEKDYILHRQKNQESYTTTLPRNKCSQDLMEISKKIQAQKLACLYI